MTAQAPPTTSGRRFVGFTQAAEYLRHIVTPRGLRSWVFNETVPFAKVNGRLVFDLDQLDRWIDERTVSPSAK